MSSNLKKFLVQKQQEASGQLICAHCSQPIADDQPRVNAEGVTYHSKCFCCDVCNVIFREADIPYIPSKGKIYCPDCYHNLQQQQQQQQQAAPAAKSTYTRNSSATSSSSDHAQQPPKQQASAAPAKTTSTSHTRSSSATSSSSDQQQQPPQQQLPHSSSGDSVGICIECGLEVHERQAFQLPPLPEDKHSGNSKSNNTQRVAHTRCLRCMDCGKHFIEHKLAYVEDGSDLVCPNCFKVRNSNISLQDASPHQHDAHHNTTTKTTAHAHPQQGYATTSKATHQVKYVTLGEALLKEQNEIPSRFKARPDKPIHQPIPKPTVPRGPSTAHRK